MPHTLLPWQKQRIELAAADSTFIASYYGGTQLIGPNIVSKNG